jgi:hypothetical protein
LRFQRHGVWRAPGARAAGAGSRRDRRSRPMSAAVRPRSTAPARWPHSQREGAAIRPCRDRMPDLPRSHPSGGVRCRRSR